MDLNDADQSCQNTDVRIVGKKLDQEPASNNIPVESSDKMGFESITENENAPVSHKQLNGYFRKETKSCVIVENIWKSFTAFQRTIVDTDKVAFHNDAFHDHASISERSPISCIHTSSNLLPNTSKPRIDVIAEINEGNVKKTGIIPNLASPIKGSLTFGSTIIPKCKNSTPTSNAGIHKREIQCDIFKEDDDWDIYQPGIVTKEPVLNTKSSQESLFSFERPMLKNAEYLLKNNFKSSINHDSCQRVSTFMEQGTSCSPSSKSVRNGGTIPEWNEERMLKEVKEFFFNNPVEKTDNLSYQDRKKLIITAPYYTNDFAMRLGLPASIESLNLPEDPSKASRLLAAYKMINSSGISENDFLHYISIHNQRLTRISPPKWYAYSESYEMDPSTMQDLDIIQDLVGPDIFDMIYEQLRTADEQFLALFRDQDLLNRTVQFWSEYEKNILLGEQRTDNRDNFLPQRQADNTSDVVSEDILVSLTKANFPSTTSLNDYDLNSYADDRKVKGRQQLLKNSQSSTDLSKEKSIKPNGILGTELKSCSPILQSTNQDSKEIRSSFDSLQPHSVKSNGSPDTASVILPHIQNSVDQHDEKKSSKVHSVKSKNFLNNATHYSDQNPFKEKARGDQSRKTYEALENASKEQPRVRKYVSQDDDAKSRKKKCLEEDSNTGQTESQKEKSPRR